MSVTPEEIRDIAEAAAEKAIQKTLLTIGMDTIDPDAILKLQADFRHLRVWRESTEAVKKRALLTAIGVLVTGAIGWLIVAMHRGS